MIKKLRKKFLISIFCMITAIFVIVLALIVVLTKNAMIDKSIAALEYYAARSSDELLRDKNNVLFGKNTSEFANYNIFILEYNTVFNNINVFGVEDTLDSEKRDYIFSLLKDTLDRDDGMGIIEKYDLRYRRTHQLNTIKIVYLDKTYEDFIIHESIVRIIIMGALGWIAFFAITIIITEIVLKPVEKSWKQQQRLVSDVSHELKTPVAVIRSNIDLISQNPTSTVESQEKWLSYIRNETDRLTSLINNALYLAKTDEDKKEIALEPLNLSELCEESVLPFESYCFENGLTLEYTIANDIIINGDPNLLKQLVVIFLDNACKYSDKGKRVIFSLSVDQSSAIMSITNFGKVILPDEAKHIFERFYRADEARSHSGYGLGLSIAKSIIDAHKGKISLQSGETDGTVFTCVFRLADQK